MGFKKENFVEEKPFNYLESEVPIVVKPIEEDFVWGTIGGRHLLSPTIAKNPERQGDGWLCEELADGRLFAAVLDISLAEDLLYGSDQEPITEKRLLSDLELYFGEYLRTQDPARLKSVDILGEITGFEPNYLKIWGDQLSWGFSLSVGMFDPKRNIADLANLGTNIVAAEKSQGQFQAVLSPNSRFYTPYSIPNQTHGGRIKPQERVLSFQRGILFTTDGIRVRSPFLRPKEVILEGAPSSLLVPGQKAEGLYIVIKRKVI